jgi:hypothetical protein
MTYAYITIDTEYSSGLFQGSDADSRLDNFRRSIACVTPEGPAGITHKLALFKRHGIRAVFFVDPMPAMVWGQSAIEDIVWPILEAGQDVQLHCHTEWLELAGDNAVLKGRTGKHIKEFAFEEQCRVLEFARDSLVAAGAPRPVAFRAGNYGANDDTLRALAEIGIRYDSSHCPGLIGVGECEIALGQGDRTPLLYEGVIELPIGCIGTMNGGLRHAQITALSLDEMVAAIEHARDTDQSTFILVTHSFELINRSTMAINRVVRSRFEGLCKALSKMPGVKTGNFLDSPLLQSGPRSAQAPEPLPANIFRTGRRLAEQVVSNTLYGAL